jgi:hypothetical protein
VSSPSRLLRVALGGRYIDKYITTKSWIILASVSNHAEDLTGMIGVASTQRYYNTVTVINAATRCLRRDRHNESPLRSGSSSPPPATTAGTDRDDRRGLPPVQRYYDAVTVTKAVERPTGMGKIERGRSPPRS